MWCANCTPKDGVASWACIRRGGRCVCRGKVTQMGHVSSPSSKPHYGSQAAIDADPPVIGITPFNEWHEVTQIEPTIPFAGPSFVFEDHAPGGTRSTRVGLFSQDHTGLSSTIGTTSDKRSGRSAACAVSLSSRKDARFRSARGCAWAYVRSTVTASSGLSRRALPWNR